jgi:hypothetical protein
VQGNRYWSNDIMMRNCEDNIYHAYLRFLQDMQEMKNCYDSLLSAAAATANSAYGKLITTFYENDLLRHCEAYDNFLCFFSDKKLVCSLIRSIGDILCSIFLTK